jgi:hypothetical protein
MAGVSRPARSHPPSTHDRPTGNSAEASVAHPAAISQARKNEETNINCSDFRTVFGSAIEETSFRQFSFVYGVNVRR